MRYQRLTGFLAVALTALPDSVTAAPEVKTIWETQCWPDKETRGNELNCLSAMSSYGRLIPSGGGRGGPTDGCREVAFFEDCGIEICNLRPADTTVSYGAIIAAAQIQHSICRNGDGTTGGITLVEGFQQPGEPHSYAEIHLASGKLTEKNRYQGDNDPQQPDVPGVINRDTSSADPRPGSGVSGRRNRNAKRAESVPIHNTFFSVFEQWADRSSVDDADITGRLQSQLTDRLVNDWNRDRGRGEHRSAIGRVRDESQGVEYTLAYHANTGTNINAVPIVDRRPVVDGLFTLRRRLGYPNILTATVWNEDRGQEIGHFTLMMVTTNPPEVADMTMQGLRRVAIQFSGGSI